jgi:hypothetical protein
VFAVVQCCPDEVQRDSVLAADELDHDVRVRFRQVQRAVCPSEFSERICAPFIAVERADL